MRRGLRRAQFAGIDRSPPAGAVDPRPPAADASAPPSDPAADARSVLHRTARLGGVLLALTAAAGATAERASGAPYVAWSCATAAGAPLGATDWSPTRTAPITTFSSTCGTPSGTLEASAFAADQNPFISAGAGWAITAPDGARITGFDVWWSNAVNPGGTPPFGRIQVYAAATGNDGSAYVRDDGAFGAPGEPLSDANHQAFGGLATQTVSLMAWCASTCTGPTRMSASYALYRSRVVVEDPAAPTGTASGLPESGRIAGATPIAVDATDVGGGVRALELRVDGQPVGRAEAGGGCTDVAGVPFEYASIRPCPSHLPATLTLDPVVLLGTLPHRVTVLATDAAGQTSTLLSRPVAAAAPAALFASGRGFFNPDLDLTAPRRVNGAGGGPAKLTLGLVDATVRFGQTPVLDGQLTTPEGQPIAGARVWRAVADPGGGWRITGEPLVSSPAGRLGGWFAPRQPSRRVALLYFPYSDAADSFMSPLRRLEVAVGVTLESARRVVRPGGRVRLTARLAVRVDKGRSVRGTLQVYVDGRWRTLRQLRFRHGARTLRRVVRLRPSGGHTAYRLRVRVPAQRGLPYATGTSRPAVVLIRR
jgi:hypothetical protein